MVTVIVVGTRNEIVKLAVEFIVVLIVLILIYLKFFSRRHSIVVISRSSY